MNKNIGMIRFLKENGFPVTIIIETEDFKDKFEGAEGFEGYHSVIKDEEGKVITQFAHKDLRARVHWANGYFTAFKSDLMRASDALKIMEAEKILKRIDQKKATLAEMKEHNKAAWDIYGSELCAGGMLSEEEKLQNEINQDMEKFLDTMPNWLREYSGAQM
jgi:hypothetical protein